MRGQMPIDRPSSDAEPRPSAHRRSWRGRGVALTAVAVLVVAVSSAGSTPSALHRTGIELFDAVFRHVAAQAVDSLSTDALYEHAARGLVHELGDPYADLYSPVELAAFLRNSIGNSYGGLGMGIEQSGDEITVTTVFAGYPAAAAGVQIGDRIVAVDGEPTKGWTADHVSSRTTGPVGIAVEVTLARPGVTTPMRERMVRSRVHVPSVPYALMLDAHTGYIPVQHFSETAADEAARAVTRLRAAGAVAFVVDLRGNGGGDLDAALNVTNIFLRADQPVVSVRYRGQPPQLLKTREQGSEMAMPLAVLIDGGTASASEIVAGALQDHDRAVLVGTPSFGKGLVQTMFPLDGGWALKMTTGRWFTPSGRSIHRNRTLVNHRLVNDDTTPAPKSLVDARAGRPTYRSDAGRTLFGGGGITPDVFVSVDTFATATQPFLRVLAEHGTDARRALDELALQVTPAVAAAGHADYAANPTWRTAYYARLQAHGLTVDRSTFDAGAPVVDRLIDREIARRAFGDSAVFRRGIQDDAPLRAAVSLLHGTATEQQVLAAADKLPS
jgi:carboxyl-terminal processing protease